MEIYTDGYVCQFRILRRKYGITLRELAQYTGISSQYISSVELCQTTGSAASHKRIEKAMQAILESRQTDAEKNLSEFCSLRKHLFDKVKESEAMKGGK